ncbi:MAG: response regulator, partial [Bacteroidota bacterium]
TKFRRLDSLAAFFQRKDIAKSLDYYQQALTEALQLKDSLLINEVYRRLGGALCDNSDYNESVEAWASSLAFAQTRIDSIKSLRGFGAVYADMGESDKALSHFLEALRLAGDNYDNYKVHVLNQIGLLYRDIGEYEKAMSYFRDLVALKHKIGDQTLYRSQMNIGVINLDFDQYDSAIHYFELSYAGMDKEKEKYGVSLYHNNMGSALSDMGRYADALPHALAAIKLLQEGGQKRRLANSYNLLSFIQLGLRNHDQAELYALKSKALQDTSSANRVRSNSLRYLIEAKIRQSDTTEVLDLIYELLDVKDKQHDTEKTHAFGEMAAKFDLEKKEKEILQKNLDLTRAQSQIETQAILRNSLIGGLLLMVVIALLAIRNHRLKSKANARLARKNSEIQELTEAKSRWFVNVSHELRTPLTLVKGPIEQVIAGDKLHPAVKEDMQLAHRNLGQLEKLINEILDLSKMESGKMSLNRRAVNLSVLCQQTVAAFDSLAMQRGIALRVKIEPSIVMKVDYDKVYKVITNLISNALKFTNEHGEVLIALSYQEQGAVISVKDTGEGISSEDVLHVFDRFYQSGKKGSARRGGTGIGLSLSREIARLHDGSLEVNSQLGVGSEFLFLIPGELLGVVPQPVEPLITEPTEVDELIAFSGFSDGKPRMLLVDDNSDMRSFIKSFLKNDYQITEAIDGKDALDKLTSCQPDIILTDIMMPRMDGIDFIKAVKENEDWRKVPLIALTALARESDKLYTLQIGIDDYLVKPFNPRELKVRAFNLISNAIERRSISPEEKVLSHEEKLMQRLQSEVEDNISVTSFNVSRLADVAAMSERQLYRTVKQISGLTPSQFVREIRLQKAMTFLEQNRYATISELSHAVGFEYPGYFTTVFEKRFGNKPAEYMQTL